MATSRKDTDWEFDAPKYYDFTKPDGSNDRPDAWFGTGYQPNDAIHRTPTRQLTEPASRIARPEKTHRVELSVAPSSNKVKDSQLAGHQKKRIDIFSALANRATTTQTVASGQKTTTIPPPPQFSSGHHQDRILRRPIANNNTSLQETKTARSLLHNLPVRPQAVEKSQPPSRDIIAALTSTQKHHNARASQREREEPLPPPTKRPRLGIFGDLNKPKAENDNRNEYDATSQRSFDVNKVNVANNNRIYSISAPGHFAETAKVNAKSGPDDFQKSDKNASEDLMEDDVQSLGIVDDADLDIDEEFNKSVERIAEERIDKSFIRRLSSVDGVIPKPRQRTQSSASLFPDELPDPEGSGQEDIETAKDGNDDLTRPTDFSAILKKVDSIRAQLAAAEVPALSEQQADLSTASQDGMQVDYETDDPRPTKRDTITMSSIDERIERARRIIAETLEQSKTWFERKPISPTSSG